MDGTKSFAFCRILEGFVDGGVEGCNRSPAVPTPSGDLLESHIALACFLAKPGTLPALAASGGVASSSAHHLSNI